jgi:hypothetical protein
LDFLAHGLYGATLCSRTGLAGGRRGAPAARGFFALDWTVWAAAGFGVMPDVASIGVSFAQMIIRGHAPSFHDLPPHVFGLYHCTHSLVIAAFVLLLLRAFARPLAVPALAWPVHIAMDSVSHGDGRWQTLMLYPLSNWHFHGVNWWQHAGMMQLYWGILPVLWLGIHLWRRGVRREEARTLSADKRVV